MRAVQRFFLDLDLLDKDSATFRWDLGQHFVDLEIDRSTYEGLGRQSKVKVTIEVERS